MDFADTEIMSRAYQYKALDSLITDIDEQTISEYGLNSEKIINICPYQVITDSRQPFLQFLLMKPAIIEELSFINIGKLALQNNEKMSYIQTYLHSILSLTFVNFEQDNIIDKDNVEYKGFYIYNNEIFVFFDITKCSMQLNDIYRMNELWFALPSEIVNNKVLSGIHIEEYVTHFFTLNPEFNYLYNDNGDRYEVPSVCYVSKLEKKTNFTYIFGETSKDDNAIFGAYYYFTSFKNCIKQILENPEYMNESKIGIVRFALFLETTKLVQNLVTDETDNSNIKKERYNDDNLETNYERLTARISDHDGKWTNQYESIILSDIKLDNDTLIKDTPVFCIKNYDQQYPLSFHFVTRKQLEKYKNNNNDSEHQFVKIM